MKIIAISKNEKDKIINNEIERLPLDDREKGSIVVSLEYIKKFDRSRKIEIENLYIEKNMPFEIKLSSNLLAVYSSSNKHILYYATYNVNDLKELAKEYSLGIPIKEDDYVLYDKIEEYSYEYPAEGNLFILVSVDFDLTYKPLKVTLYKSEHLHNGWDLWMSGVSYVNKQIKEYGQVMIRTYWDKYTKLKKETKIVNKKKNLESVFKNLEVIFSKEQNNTNVYKYDKFPLKVAMNWSADIYDKYMNKVDTKYFNPSYCLKRFLQATTNSDNDYPFLKTENMIRYWIGDASYENKKEKEYFFAVTEGTKQIDEIAKFFNLKVPYDEILKKVIDKNPEKIRVKFLDLYFAGKGKYVPVILCSLVFDGDVARELVLYTFNRPWETEDDCEVIKEYNSIDNMISNDLE